MKTLNVLYACDENYAPYAGISMRSLFENNRDIKQMRVYVVADNVSNLNCEKFMRQAEEFGREVIIVDAAEIVEKIKSLNIPSYRGSYTTNFRMFFQTFIPDDAEILLYIDCDTVVTGSLSELLTLDMGGKVVGVVRDSLTVRYKSIIGFAHEDDYFNAGVTFIDVTEWKRQDITSRLLDYISNVRAQYCNPDQDLLNIVLKDKKYILPPEYNFQPSHRAFSDKVYFSVYRHSSYYTHDQLENARKNPKILHAYRFIGDFPWHKGNLHPDTPVFDAYMKRSLWSDYVKKPSNRGIIFKIEKIMYRIFPKKLFLSVFEKITFRNFRKQDASLKKQSV